MNAREYAVLDALNIASTQYGKFVKGKGTRFQATAAQIAEILKTDERVGEPFTFRLTSVQVGATLSYLASGPPRRPEALVERVGTKKWRLSRAGVGVLIA